MLFVVLTDFSIQICWKFDRLMKQPKLDSWKPGVTKKKISRRTNAHIAKL